MATQKFDYIEFETTLSDIKVKLAELKYIDDALEWMRAQNSLPDTEGFADEHADGAIINSVVYTLGTTYPFQYVVDYWAPDGSDQRAGDAHLQSLATAAAGWAYPAVSGLRQDNIEITKPYPGDFENTANALVELGQVIEADVPLDLGNFGTTLAHWQGLAALAFDRNFVGPFKDVREAHKVAVARLAVCFSTAKAIVDCGQQSLMNAVVTVQELVDAQLRQRHDSRTADPISKDTLTLIGSTISLIGAAAAVTGAGAAPGAVAGAVGSGISYAADFLPDDAAEPVTVSAATAEETLEELDSRFFNTRVSYLKQWNSFRLSDVEPVASEIASDASAGRLWPPRPTMNSGDPGGFHHESSGQYH